jgi:hypothetical protein
LARVLIALATARDSRIPGCLVDFDYQASVTGRHWPSCWLARGKIASKPEIGGPAHSGSEAKCAGPFRD